MMEAKREGVTRRLESAAVNTGEKLRTAGTFMSRLTPDLALEIVAVAGRRQGEPGTEFVPAGVRGERLYIVANGTVEVLRPSTQSHAETVLAVLGPGDCFGEMSILTEQPTSASVRARTACALFTLTRPQLQRLLKGSPELARVFSQLLAERLSALNRTLEGEMERGMRGKLAALPFPELVQLLHAGRRTGTVFLSCGGRQGRLGFQDGRLMAAELGEASGENAFFELARLSEGEFKLEQKLDDFPEAARIQTDTLGLLMEALRRMDESPGNE
jgi:CRP-like cAMP-binding protein